MFFFFFAFHSIFNYGIFCYFENCFEYLEIIKIYLGNWYIYEFKNNSILDVSFENSYVIEERYRRIT